MKAGFTMTELLVVIAIIAALGGVAFPLVRGFSQATDRTTCLSNLRGFGAVVEAATIDNNGRLPNLAMGRERRNGRDDVMEEYFLEFGIGGDSFECPADHGEFEESGSSYFWNHLISNIHTSRLAVFGMQSEGGAIPLISDKESFHGDEAGTNFLFADYSVGDELLYDVDSR